MVSLICSDFIGYEQGKEEIEHEPAILPKLAYPPHTGIGVEEDSLGSCISLVGLQSFKFLLCLFKICMHTYE